MPAIVGPVTPGRIAFALGSIGVGALVGTAIADHRGQDLGKGALFGGIAAVAGVGLLFGGAYAWNRFSAARSGAGAGAAQVSTTFTRLTTPATTAAPTASAAAGTFSTLSLPPASSFFPAAPSVAVPSTARTPALPVAPSSGGDVFLNVLRGFTR